ncbi:hypothetical protein DE146DRAFT_732671 [Phaeosphaeria sp. MPI-PUGE-AT-0046c]|nr:hypothetical protein DE146DRAFT_732671 [Phaeosphaeria sp. MPI-PUGE-AT-0046c]
MAIGKNPEAHFIRARARGAQKDTGIVNDKPVLKGLEEGTKQNHRRQLALWDQFVEDNSKPDLIVPVHSLKWMKDFFIYGPLKDELKMPERKRARRYANRNHLSHFARQSWKVDWFEYPLPGTRVIDWGLTLAILYSSARIGEYIESTARRGSGRGLRYKDLMVVAFLNEDNRPELAMQLTKDAKNMTNTPHRRPQHAFTEGRYPRPLYQNALIPYLAAFLSRHPLEGPVILNQSTKGAKRIENAGAFGSRHRECGIRAGFPVPPTIHDWRAEGLFFDCGEDKHYSPDARMGQAGNAGVDGQATFLGDERRDVVNDAFRELTLPRNPNLWHRLPAAKQYEIENRQGWLKLEEKMAALKLEPDMNTKQQRKEEAKLRKKKSKLIKRELRKWQKKQPYQPGDPQGYHRKIFDRCSFMMPARRRLAEDMFEVADLRSPAGLRVIQDMIELCERERER